MREWISLLCHLIFLWVHTPNFPPEIFLQKICTACRQEIGFWISSTFFCTNTLCIICHFFPPSLLHPIRIEQFFFSFAKTFDQQWNYGITDYGCPMEPFFIEIQNFWVWQTNWADKFLGIWSIFGQIISTHFGTVSPLSMFSIIQALFLQKPL